MLEPRRILVARTDRLGDVMMTLPALEYLRRALPEWTIDFYCRQDLHSLLKPHLDTRNIGLVEGGVDWGSIDVALLFFAPSADFFSAWRKVPSRFGVLSRWSSWFWLNRGVSQRRSEGLKSEAIYNLEIAQALVANFKKDAPALGEFQIRVIGDSLSQIAAQSVLQEVGIVGSYLVVHPGMGGSALNLSAEGYAKLLSQWPSAQVLLSAGPSPHDAPLVEALGRLVPRARRLPAVALPVLRELFRMADLVIAPSTGPLHLAHYVGTDTLGVFSPVRAQRPERWAPWGGAGRSRVISPAHACPGTRACLGEKCDRHPCLETLVREPLPTGWADGLMRGS